MPPTTSASSTFYRRPLPEPLVAFASPQGRALFQEALAAGGMEGWFALSEQFHTQSDPAFCGLGTLVVVLNALQIDPGRIWKGPWRWYAEELLDCCLPLQEVRAKGVTLEELSCLARCNGATAVTNHADAGNLDELRRAVAAAAAKPEGPVVVAAYARDVLGQTGSGHYSPIAGYHPHKDLVLILDVARFKYPPHWVPLTLLWRAMQPIDPASGKGRGWIELDRNPQPSAILFRLTGQGDLPNENQRAADALASILFQDLPGVLQQLDRPTPQALLGKLDEALRDVLGNWMRHAFTSAAPLSHEHRAEIERVLAALRATNAYQAVATLQPAPPTGSLEHEALAMLVLALPAPVWQDWGAPPLGALTAVPEGETKLAAEVAALREQISTLRMWQQRSRRTCR